MPGVSPADDASAHRVRSPAGLVRQFHVAFGIPVRDNLQEALEPSEMARWRELLGEEVREFLDAAARADITSVADSLADIVYVAYGIALAFGIDLDEVIQEVHHSNMSKLDEEGKPLKSSKGSILKGSAYRPPDIGRAIRRRRDSDSERTPERTDTQPTSDR